MVVDAICHCGDFKLKERLNMEAEKHEEKKNQDWVASFPLLLITTAGSALLGT